jgi:CDP-diacylglycerol---glycerol-3-phosphate 3-phosphatidyltransferase
VISVYQLKPAFQALLRPLVRGLARLGVSANHVTLFACLLSVSFGVALGWSLMAQEHMKLFLLLVPVVFFVRMALNAIDGMLAREHDMKTPLGALLNELCDVLSDSALILPFVYVASSIAVALFAVLAAVTEVAGILGPAIGASRRYDGPMGKSDRALVISLAAIALAFGWLPENALFMGILGLCGLCLLTTLNRVRGALAEVRAGAQREPAAGTDGR